MQSYNELPSYDEQMRQGSIAAVDAASADPRIDALYAHLADIWQPPIWTDYVNVNALGTVNNPYALEGFWLLSRMLLLPVGATFPTRVDITVPSFSNMPFSLTSAKDDIDRLHIRIMGGTYITFQNYDATNAGRVYLEFTKYTGKV
jgi:hypothetical protein